MTLLCALSNGDMCAYGLTLAGAFTTGLEGTSGSVSMSGGRVQLPLCDFHHTLGQSWGPGPPQADGETLSISCAGHCSSRA